MKGIIIFISISVFVYNVSAQITISQPAGYANLTPCTNYTISYAGTLVTPKAQFYSGYSNSTSPIGSSFALPQKTGTYVAPNFPSGIYTMTIYDANTPATKMSVNVIFAAIT